MRCGLLGKKLGHSYSPQIHSHLGEYSYELFEKTPEELGDFLLYGDFSGLNVTMPYKKDVIPYCTELTPRAALLGAVNTIVRRKDGKLIGHNTDYFGFQSMLERSGLDVAGKKVLVLGSGGASATAVCVLRELKAKVIIVSRRGENNYENISTHSDAAVIVNATPVGMYPDTGLSPVDLSIFPKLEGVLDIVYNPARTQLLLNAEKRGLVTENGLWMLVAQAKESAEWFSDVKINDDAIQKIHGILRRQMENTILIGMPGCGKSTIGKQLAKHLGKQFVDADAEIVSRAGISIPEIFEKYGEVRFREIEAEVLGDLGKQSGLVIATGGGCVTRTNNYDLLHQNGTIIWIQRNLHALPTDGRPLSHKDKMEAMYEIRKPLYASFSDYIVENNSELEEALSHLIDMGGIL